MKKSSILLSVILLFAMTLIGCATKNVIQEEPIKEEISKANDKESVIETTEVATDVETEKSKDIEIDNSLISNYDIFEVTSDNLHDGKWDDIISYTNKGENKSPQLSWEPVDGASSYAIYMVDTSMQYWIHWKASDVKETVLPLGHAKEMEYIGPYPPETGTHTYEIYVIALKNSVERLKGGLNGQNQKFTTFIDALDTDAEGNTGNIVGAAHLVGTFTN